MDDSRLLEAINGLQEKMLLEFGNVNSKLSMLESRISHHHEEILILREKVYVGDEHPSILSRLSAIDGKIGQIEGELRDIRDTKARKSDHYQSIVIAIMSVLLGGFVTFYVELQLDKPNEQPGQALTRPQ